MSMPSPDVRPGWTKPDSIRASASAGDAEKLVEFDPERVRATIPDVLDQEDHQDGDDLSPVSTTGCRLLLNPRIGAGD